MRKNTGLAITLALLAGAAVPAAADIATTVQVQYDENTLAFDGTVSSPNKHCLGGREVTITRFDGDTPTTIGTATTNAHGAFSFSDPGAQAGTYEATTPAEKVKGKKSKHRKHRRIYHCAAGTSGKQQL